MKYKRVMARAALGIVTTAGTVGLLAVPVAANGDQGNGVASSHLSQGNAATSGDVNSPQPRSNADDNGHGANVTGPYDSTRDGAPSANGNGNGNGVATGKPCAGCVGKADNKNPPGQMPDASDGNNGYECDGNHGIARSNPAHTGCESGSSDNPPPPECVPTETTACTPETPGGPETPGVPGTSTSTPPSPTVLGETMTVTRPPAATVLGVTVAAPATGTAASADTAAARTTSVGEALARTGADLAALVPFALVLVVAGAASVIAGRRRLATADATACRR